MKNHNDHNNSNRGLRSRCVSSPRYFFSFSSHLVFQDPVSKTGKKWRANQTKTGLGWTAVLVFSKKKN